MLLRFEVQNFLSFRENISFNMLPGDFNILPHHIVNPIQGYDFLKAAALYGANGSGKSNLIAAIFFLRELVTNGTSDYNKQIGVRPFKLDDFSINNPTAFLTEFLIDKIIYRYEIEILQNIIRFEGLYRVKKNEDYDVIFERTTSEKGKTSLRFGYDLFDTQTMNTRKRIYEKELRDNQPFFYEGANKKIELIQAAHKWFLERLNIVTPDSFPSHLLEFIIKDKNLAEQSNKLLISANTGVNNLKFERVPLEAALGYLSSEQKLKLHGQILSNGSRSIRKEDGSIFEIFVDGDSNELVAGRLMTQHLCENGKMVDFEIYEESDGTRRFIDVIPALILSAQKNEVFIIDEIERSLHPILVKKLIEFFYQNQTSDMGGQLIFTTHEVMLLNDSLFRPDEVWFFNKKESGASDLYSISDFKKQYGENIMEAYLGGEFGAIPFFGKNNYLGAK